MKKSIIILYVLLVYITFQLFWWSMLLIRFEPDKKAMVIGEVAVFIFLLLVGAYKIQQAYAEEERLHTRKQNFLLSVTHELKSPLASIKLYIETILKRDLDKSKQTLFLKNALKDTERLHDMLENMLLASRYDKLTEEPAKEVFDFSDLLTKITERLQINVCEGNMLLATIEPGITLWGDAFAIRSAATNLVENAIKYSQPCGQIQVDLTRNEDKIVFTVSDLGVGIPDAEKGRIFEKFYRVGNENTRTTKGSGLGLFIVKQVLDNHQARIEVRNNHPSGTIFQVTFSV